MDRKIVWLGIVMLGLVQAAGGATYTVTNCADSGTGSLRWAMGAAILNADNDLIEFNIPQSIGYDPTTGGFTTEAGVSWWRLKVASALPILNNPNKEIRGSTQTTNVGNLNPFGPEVEIDGTNTLGWGVFTITNNNCTIEGLVINRAPGGLWGVEIDRSNNNQTHKPPVYFLF